MDFWSITLLIAIGVFCVNYLFKNYNFFKRNGLIHVPSIPGLGATAFVIFRRMSFADLMQKLYYFQPDAKYIGFYATLQPTFLLRDPELIKEVFVKNFEAFPGRRGFDRFNDYLLSKNLFSLEGQKWRNVRTLLSPAFTSSKMKTMFTLMTECARDFATFLSTSSAVNSDMDMKDIFARYTNDVIATCAFGIKVDSMKNPTNKFYAYGKEATSFIGLRSAKFLFLRTFPELSRILGLRLINDYVASFFKDIVKTTIETRDAENITRPDMIQLMMDVRGKRGADSELDIDDMTAQAFIFFFGGFDTSSTAMSFTAHEIAVNPDIQLRLRREIDAVLEETNGQVTYEAVNRLEYLDAVINESLRMYPPLVFVERMCDKSFELPPALPGEKPFVLKKGMVIWVPIYALHRDVKYCDEPDKFRPERFLDGEINHNSPHYLPFGVGPRMCIANRFALLEVKVLLFYLLAMCELKPCAKTTIPMELTKKGLTMAAEGGFWLNVQRRSDMHPTIRAQMRTE